MKTLYSLEGKKERADFYLEDVQHLMYDMSAPMIVIGFEYNSLAISMNLEDLEIKYAHLLNQWKKTTKATLYTLTSDSGDIVIFNLNQVMTLHLEIDSKCIIINLEESVIKFYFDSEQETQLKGSQLINKWMKLQESEPL